MRKNQPHHAPVSTPANRIGFPPRRVTLWGLPQGGGGPLDRGLGPMRLNVIWALRRPPPGRVPPLCPRNAGGELIPTLIPNGRGGKPARFHIQKVKIKENQDTGKVSPPINVAGE
jgi:hypothetical protein